MDHTPLLLPLPSSWRMCHTCGTVKGTQSLGSRAGTGLNQAWGCPSAHLAALLQPRMPAATAGLAPPQHVCCSRCSGATQGAAHRHVEQAGLRLLGGAGLEAAEAASEKRVSGQQKFHVWVDREAVWRRAMHPQRAVGGRAGWAPQPRMVAVAQQGAAQQQRHPTVCRRCCALPTPSSLVAVDGGAVCEVKGPHAVRHAGGHGGARGLLNQGAAHNRGRAQRGQCDFRMVGWVDERQVRPPCVVVVGRVRRAAPKHTPRAGFRVPFHCLKLSIWQAKPCWHQRTSRTGSHCRTAPCARSRQSPKRGRGSPQCLCTKPKVQGSGVPAGSSGARFRSKTVRGRGFPAGSSGQGFGAGQGRAGQPAMQAQLRWRKCVLKGASKPPTRQTGHWSLAACWCRTSLSRRPTRIATFLTLAS